MAQREPAERPQPGNGQTLGEQIAGMIERLPPDHVTLGELLDLFGDEGLLLLMLPFGLVPFSNTLPALALLAYAIGFIQRDGVAVLLGHVANVGTIVYFSVLIGGGGLVAQELFKRFGA